MSASAPAAPRLRASSADAPSTELIPQIQRELGSDAIIVRRREGLTGGVLGFFQRAFVEIEAMPGAPGIDVYDEAESAEPAPAPSAAPPLSPPPGVAPGVPAPAATPPALGLPAPAQYQSAPQHQFPPVSPPVAQPQPQPRTQPPPPTPLSSAPVPGPPTAYAPAQPPGEPAPAPGAPGAPGPPVAPAPFYARETVAPGAGAGSAYVTAHLAALARADRTKPAPPRRAAPARGVEPAPWSGDFQELKPADVSGLSAGVGAVECPAPAGRKSAG